MLQIIFRRTVRAFRRLGWQSLALNRKTGAGLRASRRRRRPPRRRRGGRLVARSAGEGRPPVLMTDYRRRSSLAAKAEWRRRADESTKQAGASVGMRRQKRGARGVARVPGKGQPPTPSPLPGHSTPHTASRSSITPLAPPLEAESKAGTGTPASCTPRSLSLSRVRIDVAATSRQSFDQHPDGRIIGLGRSNSYSEITHNNTSTCRNR